eukprot:gb/GFBE01032067.1/.p1 GENE.gb/GFBE01032067.1/~~gb/GFBE01032067.1/.p1  ORF type:complete len:183 (+),score=44.63 gb/GFBE01032067.1/:1-549(+)
MLGESCTMKGGPESLCISIRNSFVCVSEWDEQEDAVENKRSRSWSPSVRRHEEPQAAAVNCVQQMTWRPRPPDELKQEWQPTVQNNRRGAVATLMEVSNASIRSENLVLDGAQKADCSKVTPVAAKESRPSRIVRSMCRAKAEAVRDSDMSPEEKAEAYKALMAEHTYMAVVIKAILRACKC